MRKVKWGVLSTADIARRETIPGMQIYLDTIENLKNQFEKAKGPAAR